MITSCPADFLTGRKKKGTSFFAQFQTGGSIKNAMKETVTGLQTFRVEPSDSRGQDNNNNPVTFSHFWVSSELSGITLTKSDFLLR
jgi:hypothetical protein